MGERGAKLENGVDCCPVFMLSYYRGRGRGWRFASLGQSLNQLGDQPQALLTAAATISSSQAAYPLPTLSLVQTLITRYGLPTHHATDAP